MSKSRQSKSRYFADIFPLKQKADMQKAQSRGSKSRQSKSRYAKT
jgi:hypothetical protein